MEQASKQARGVRVLIARGGVVVVVVLKEEEEEEECHVYVFVCEGGEI